VCGFDFNLLQAAVHLLLRIYGLFYEDAMTSVSGTEWYDWQKHFEKSRRKRWWPFMRYIPLFSGRK
jgi:hypothetical protein